MPLRSQGKREKYGMSNLRVVVMFGVNLLLISAVINGIFYKLPYVDEYLALFMISPIFILAPFLLSVRLLTVLFGINFVFLLFYRFTGALNTIDVFILTFLFAAVSIGSYFLKSLRLSFLSYYESDISEKKRVYNGLVDELDMVESKGRKAEKELERISRLYEVTKKLTPALKIDALLDLLFDFLEENFRIQTAHLLIFEDNVFLRGKSKSVGEGEVSSDINYKEIAHLARKQNLKPFFIERGKNSVLFETIKIKSEIFMSFPLFVGDKLCAIVAVESDFMFGYRMFDILIPQIALEFRKVKLYEEVEKLSIIDGLTGVYLRRYFMDRLSEEINRSSRLTLNFSIAMIDIDHFKRCNDKYGHLSGDAVLRGISERLKFSVREVDMVARYGGEEFSILLPETSKELALVVAERLRDAIESNKVKVNSEELAITISAGVATYPEDGIDAESLIEKADTALYKAKTKGRNMVCAV